MGQLPETEMCWTERGPQNSARKRPKKATTLKNKNAANSQKKKKHALFPQKGKKQGYVFLVSVCILGNTLPNPKNDDVTR